VLLEGSAEGVEARSARMAGLLGQAEVAADPPAWWPGAPHADAGETLIRVSFWVSALSRVLDAIEAAADQTGVSAVTAGSAGAGVLYVRVRPGDPSGPSGPSATAGAAAAAVAADGVDEPRAETAGSAAALRWADSRAAAEFVGALRAMVAGERGAVVVLAAPEPVQEELAARGGMSGTVPGLALMRAVKDQFDPGHRLAPGRFPEGT
jgi:glycolate oxidase FAD binding subunit